jgi:hypothetical protein
MKTPLLLGLFTLLAGLATSAGAAPPAPAQTGPHALPARPPTTRKPVASELTELARTALGSATVRVPKGARLIAARASSANVEIPIAPSKITIELTAPPRKAGPVTTTAVLVFWKDADIAARVPLRLDLDVPPEALVYDVPKGAVVTLVVQRGLVEVSAQAVAASDADIGDVVQVLLRPSGRALRAQIVARDRALAVEEGR